ncbi:hypothetical protein [Micromonospora profundi]|uniref:hypothetical protein n=1 Tax=Micromonospora profundi TaxID=1420889 RepID=UPI003651EAD3
MNRAGGIPATHGREDVNDLAPLPPDGDRPARLLPVHLDGCRSPLTADTRQETQP